MVNAWVALFSSEKRKPMQFAVTLTAFLLFSLRQHWNNQLCEQRILHQWNEDELGELMSPCLTS